MNTIMKSSWIILALLFLFSPNVLGQNPEEKIRVFQLKEAYAADVGDILQSLIPKDSDVTFSIDQRTNSLIILCDDEDGLNALGSLLSKLDVPAKEQNKLEAQMVALTVTTVIEGVDDNMAQLLAAPPDRVVKIIEEIGKNSLAPRFKNPLVGSTFMTQVMADLGRGGAFQGKSSSRQGFCHLEVQGTITRQDADQFAIRGDIQVVLMPSNDESFSTRMSTTIALTKQHPVVMGLTSIDGVQCLVIVEIR
jgi:hypothetical protein